MRKVIIAIVFVLCICSPRLYWQWKEEKPLELLIIDKTVPTDSYREHLGLNWFLTNEKITKQNGELYDKTLDYYGYDPVLNSETKSYTHRATKDLIYVADTYGVYSDDLEQQPEGNRSRFLYGGMGMQEWNEIVKSKGDDTIFVAEYNSFASPTDAEVSNEMQKFLSVHWTGWIGRYFPDLNSSEIPAWLTANYENQYNTNWDFKAGGLVFAHESDQIIIIDDSRLQSFVQFKMTEAGEGNFQGVEASEYTYWFDIVEPMNNAQVLARYEIEVDEQAEKELKEKGVPTVFPAVTYHSDNKTYYFSGDYADYTKDNLMKWQGSDRIMRIFSNEESDFFWASYIPLMRQIILQLDT